MKLDLHLAAIQDWDAYLTLFDDDWYLQHRYPIAYNYFPLNYVPDDWTVNLPSSAYLMPTSFQLNLCIMMSKRFENLSLKQIQDFAGSICFLMVENTLINFGKRTPKDL